PSPPPAASSSTPPNRSSSLATRPTSARPSPTSSPTPWPTRRTAPPSRSPPPWPTAPPSSASATTAPASTTRPWPTPSTASGTLNSERLRCAVQRDGEPIEETHLTKQHGPRRFPYSKETHLGLPLDDPTLVGSWRGEELDSDIRESDMTR